MAGDSGLLASARELVRWNDCFFASSLRVVWSVLRVVGNAAVTLAWILGIVGSFCLQIIVDAISVMPQVNWTHL